ncbi:MAG: hypothetical protein ABIZ91_01000 [Gemmatimonadaceae bacterium]
MSESGGLDLRYPIGGLFLIIGAILTVYGIMTAGNTEMYVRATAVNINLWWGMIMIVFGGVMWTLAVRGGRGATIPRPSSGGGDGD